MTNEIAQWMVLSFLVLLVLGLFRQVSVSRPPGQRAVIGGLQEGDGLPKVLVDELASLSSRFKATGATVAFVVENCAACQRLLAELPQAIRESPATYAVVVRQPSEAFREALLREVDVPIVFDEDGGLWATCRITATPLVAVVDGQGQVLRKEVTHDVARVAATPAQPS